MKLFVVSCLFVALASVSADYVVKTHENMMQYRDECVAEHKIPEDHIEEYKQSRYPDDAMTHCYLKCVLNKFGLFDDSGFDIENIHHQLVGEGYQAHDGQDDLHAKIESCIDKNEQGSEVCEWAYRGATCLFRNDLKLVQESAA